MQSFPITLNTDRLILRSPTESDHYALETFEKRNQHHLSLWRPTSSTPHLAYPDQIKKWKKEFDENTAVRFLFFLKDQSQHEIIGFCNFTQIFRGAFHACYLGYQIDVLQEGKGLMSEAAIAGIQYMFEEQNLHRIMANYMPSNTRSARLLQRLGFVIEGKAQKYLHINGKWEDHILTSLTNEHWKLP